MEDQNEENTDYVRNFFDRIPSEISKHDKRYVLSHIDQGARMRNYRGPINWLEDAMIINLACNVDEPIAALNLSVRDSSFRCYMMDTGLLVSLAFRDRPFLENELYKAILLDRLGVNEGMLLENTDKGLVLSQVECLRADKGKPEEVRASVPLSQNTVYLKVRFSCDGMKI